MMLGGQVAHSFYEYNRNHSDGTVLSIQVHVLFVILLICIVAIFVYRTRCVFSNFTGGSHCATDPSLVVPAAIAQLVMTWHFSY